MGMSDSEDSQREMNFVEKAFSAIGSGLENTVDAIKGLVGETIPQTWNKASDRAVDVAGDYIGGLVTTGLDTVGNVEDMLTGERKLTGALADDAKSATTHILHAVVPTFGRDDRLFGPAGPNTPRDAYSADDYAKMSDIEYPSGSNMDAEEFASYQERMFNANKSGRAWDQLRTTKGGFDNDVETLRRDEPKKKKKKKSSARAKSNRGSYSKIRSTKYAKGRKVAK
jgi:hypothetical protein